MLLNSNFFIAAVTLLVGFAAFFIYKRQKRDEKKDAATILLTEIRSAQAVIPDIKSRFRDSDKRSQILDEGLQIMPSESWSKYKYLFVNDLNHEEWSALNSFYVSCLEYDAAIKEKKSYFSQYIAQIWESIHQNYRQTLATYVSELDGLPEISIGPHGSTFEIPKDIAATISAFTDTYIANVYKVAQYEPIKPINDAENSLAAIKDDLLLTSVGKRLDKMASPRWWNVF